MPGITPVYEAVLRNAILRIEDDDYFPTTFPTVIVRAMCVRIYPVIVLYPKCLPGSNDSPIIWSNVLVLLDASFNSRLTPSCSSVCYLSGQQINSNTSSTKIRHRKIFVYPN
jgi:hypothetical protein